MTKEEANLAAFLRLIRFAGHHGDSDGMYVPLYGGKQRFWDTSRHPLVARYLGDVAGKP